MWVGTNWNYSTYLECLTFLRPGITVRSIHCDSDRKCQKTIMASIWADSSPWKRFPRVFPVFENRKKIGAEKIV